MAEAFAPMGESLAKALASATPAIVALLGIVTQLFNAFSSLPQPVQTFLITILAIVAAIGPMLILFGNMMKMMAMMQTAYATLTAATGLFSAANVAAAYATMIAWGPYILLLMVIIGIVWLLYSNWEKIAGFLSGVWDGMKKAFENAWNGIVAFFKAPINMMIAIINAFIRAINMIHIDIPSIEIPGIGKLGGGRIGFNIGEIAYLAEGGIVSSPTLAMIGERGPEAVIPLDRGLGAGEINITVNGTNDPERTAELVIRKFRQITGLKY